MEKTSIGKAVAGAVLCALALAGCQGGSAADGNSSTPAAAAAATTTATGSAAASPGATTSAAGSPGDGVPSATPTGTAAVDAAGTLQKAYVALSDLLAKQSGSGTAAQKSELADLRSQITAAQAAIGNEAAAALAVRPGPNAKSIEAALAPTRSAVKTAHDDLVKARDAAEALRDSLKS